MQPICLCAARVEVRRYVVDVLLELPMQCCAEPTTPCLALLGVLNYRLGMWTCLASVGALVVLVKRIRSPEALVAVWTRIFPPSLVEFF